MGGQLIVQDMTYLHHGGEDLIKTIAASAARPELVFLTTCRSTAVPLDSAYSHRRLVYSH